ncbi:NAD(P)/FAD-dependent oxidoreductase [Coraliomargarita algicola]|uniref:NAD(P)/FAD-dependent oxidoreductase n=1 Tax=Coraliomargarita algicola TaxID=3092156 RepID=A0ABZ0RLV9_9BACT|nr:NAD(P)/FAD-dependent oxidoreductase [Coraliomargarita sp. J2-16]WPJ96406.1 NAD(P)/FAD-dependent oxidoreductase [Coraliomargarita sp. J2-16]
MPKTARMTSHAQNLAPSIAIIGGGAAGYFAAITAAEANPSAQVTIYEASKRTLSKVKISGGGRCNVTHNCFEPKELATRYPRGARELRGAFHRWQPQDTIQWFAERGVPLKAEPDGRMFPITDDSQTIIDCFHQAAQAAGVKLRKECAVKSLSTLHFSASTHSFSLQLNNGEQIEVERVLIATGSLKASPLTRSLESLGHSIAPLAPSLFAFNLADKRTHGLAGLAVQNARVSYAPNVGSSLAASGIAVSDAGVKTAEPKGSSRNSRPQAQNGPILITHRGLSGPAILRLSAWQARALQKENYHFEIEINWLGDMTDHQVREQFKRLRKGKTQVKTKVFEQIPRRLWERLVEIVGISEDLKWAQLPKDKETALINELVNGRYKVQGKTTNKDEFVTCGGVSLKEINFKTMESKLVPGLHFAGECLDIDGITGGFNFQAAWTGGRIAGLAMANS